jgi:predicted RNA-binding Zn-ribbon protein involved in translation (DUF1610 family)
MVSHGMEHRIGNLLKGVGFFVAAIVAYLGSLLLLGEVYCQKCGLAGWGIPFFILMATLSGIVLTVQAFSPVRYENKWCPDCGKTTHQFQSKNEPKENQSTYVCETCGKQHIVPLCKACRKPLQMVNREGKEWYCAHDTVPYPVSAIGQQIDAGEEPVAIPNDSEIQIRRKKRRMIYLFHMLDDYRRQFPEAMLREYTRVFKRKPILDDFYALRLWESKFDRTALPRLKS